MSKLIDELDSLRELLRHDQLGELDLANWPLIEPKPAEDLDEAAIPVLEDAVEAEFAPTETATETAALDIPVLDEVIEQDAAEAMEEEDEEGLPSRTELLLLIDALVERRMQRLRPELTEQLITELARIHPALAVGQEGQE